MTGETKENVAAPKDPPDGRPAGGAEDEAYQPPKLTYVGNVHALLAGTGMSPTTDGVKGTMRP